jgi:hypothetical protein
MSICTVSELTRATPTGHSAPTARGVGPFGLAALALLCGAVASQPADAAPKLCGDRNQILHGLKQPTRRRRRRSGFPATAASSRYWSRRRVAGPC